MENHNIKSKEDLIQEIEELKKQISDFDKEELHQNHLNELEESEEKYRGLYNSIRDAIMVADTNRNIIDCNPAFYSLFGYSKTEIVGKQTVYVYENETEFKELGEAIKTHYGERPFLKTVNYKKKSGEIFPGETNVFYLKNDTGEVTGFIGLIRDITERKQAEESLQESEEKFRKAFITSPDSININRIEDGMYISINKGFTKIMGYTEEEAIGKTSFELNIWKNETDRNKLVEGLKTKGFVENLEAEFVSKSGEIKYGLMSATIMELNGVQHILSITRDITERKQIEEELKGYRNNLEQIVKERTEEIETINEELIASNEEFSAINEELTESNEKLNKANRELEDYNQLFIDREFRIKELRNIIEELEGKK